MGRIKGHPYTCPRCGYNAPLKATIKRHFYEMKGICSPLLKQIVLTEEIKQMVMAERIYVPMTEPIPAPPPVNVMAQTAAQIINNNNQTVINYIANMDVLTKLQRLSQYNDTEIQNFDEKVAEASEDIARRFEEDGPFRGGPVRYEGSKLIDLVHTVTKATDPDLNDFNVVYTKGADRILILDDGEWVDHIKDEGIMYIINILKDEHLNYYEFYLIRKLAKMTLSPQRAELEESLVKYFQFIAAFNIKPHIYGKSDADVLNTPCVSSDPVEANRVVDKYSLLYHQTAQAMTTSQKREITRSVVNIVKANTIKNSKELNKRIISMLKIDEDFKTLMINE